MKQFLLAAVLSVGAVAFTNGQASARLLKCRCYKKCCTVCCKPYNAFSPSMSGCINFDGCCPQFGFHPQGPPQGGFDPSCGDGGCGDGGCVAGHVPGGWGGAEYLPSQGGPSGLPPGGQLPAPGTQPFQAPTPMPLPPGSGAQSSYPMMYGQPVQPIGYPPVPQYGYQGGYPSPVPMGYGPASYPGYWYQQ
jgi:hypothetical protein